MIRCASIKNQSPTPPVRNSGYGTGKSEGRPGRDYTRKSVKRTACIKSRWKVEEQSEEDFHPRGKFSNGLPW